MNSKIDQKLAAVTGLKCTRSTDCADANHNQATGLRVRTSVNAGLGGFSGMNHNQSAPAGLKLKTSLKAGYKSCTRSTDCADANHNQAVQVGR